MYMEGGFPVLKTTMGVLKYFLLHTIFNRVLTVWRVLQEVKLDRIVSHATILYLC